MSVLHSRHGMKNYDGSDLSDCLPSASVTAVAAPVSSMENLQQSEVVKLLLQNRHQWAVPQEKVPSPPGENGLENVLKTVMGN